MRVADQMQPKRRDGGYQWNSNAVVRLCVHCPLHETNPAMKRNISRAMSGFALAVN